MHNWIQLSPKKKLMAALVVTGLLILGLWQYQGSTKVAYYEVTSLSVEKLINVEAQTFPRESYWYAAKEGGVVVNTPVDKGTAVAKEDVLVMLQPFDFQKKQIEIKSYVDTMNTLLEVALTSKQQESYKALLKDYQEHDQSLTQAWIAHGSVLELFRTQMISSDSYKESLIQINDQMKTYIEKTAALEGFVAALSSENKPFMDLSVKFKSGFEPMKALSVLMLPKADDGKSTAVTGEIDKQVAYKSINDGIVARKTIEKGMYIPMGAPVIEVANPKFTNLQMEVSVDQLADLKIGTEVRVKDTASAILKGKLIEIDKVITDQMQPDGNIIKLVKVTASLNENSKVAFYNNISASIVAKFSENAVVVPKDLVFEDNGNYFVWINQEGVLTEKPVEISFEVNNLYVIKSGLKKGDKLVMDTKLRLGQKIKF